MVPTRCGRALCKELHQKGVKEAGRLHHHHCYDCHHFQNQHHVDDQVLAAVRRGLTRHPLDLRGSRRALEAAQVNVIITTIIIIIILFVVIIIIIIVSFVVIIIIIIITTIIISLFCNHYFHHDI